MSFSKAATTTATAIMTVTTTERITAVMATATPTAVTVTGIVTVTKTAEATDMAIPTTSENASTKIDRCPRRTLQNTHRDSSQNTNQNNTSQIPSLINHRRTRTRSSSTQQLRIRIWIRYPIYLSDLLFTARLLC